VTRAGQATLSLKDFDRQPLIMYAAEGARYFYDMLTGLFEAAGATLSHSSLSQRESLGAAGIGAASGAGSRQQLHFDDVHFRRWNGAGGASGAVCRLAQDMTIRRWERSGLVKPNPLKPGSLRPRSLIQFPH